MRLTRLPISGRAALAAPPSRTTQSAGARRRKPPRHGAAARPLHWLVGRLVQTASPCNSGAFRPYCTRRLFAPK